MSEKTMATVSWTKADTYDIFKVIWAVGGLTLSESGQQGLAGERFQRIAFPTVAATELQQKLLRLDPTARLSN